VLLDIIRRGGEAVYGGAGLRSGMPAFGGQLTAEEIDAVLAYIKTLWGDAEREYQERLPEQ
jgi:mono/diheme cytochrome c family protein